MQATQQLNDNNALKKYLLPIEEHKEAVESGSKKLLLERDQWGNYTVRWEGGGMIAPELKGKWTSVYKITAAAENRYGKGVIKT